MACRTSSYQFCHCYNYICPGPKGDPRGCGFRYSEDYNEKLDEAYFHWLEPGEPCANCGIPIPDIGCKIPELEQQGLFNANQ